MPSISKKGLNIPSSPIRKLVPFSDQAKERGIEILHLNIGQPDIKSPIESLEAIRNNDLELLKYDYSQGSLELRQNVSNYYKRHNIKVSPENIITTIGASEALSFSMNAQSPDAFAVCEIDMLGINNAKINAPINFE